MGYFIVIVICPGFPFALVHGDGLGGRAVGRLLENSAGHQNVLQKSIVARRIAERRMYESRRVAQNHSDHRRSDFPIVHVGHELNAALLG